jgi:2-methylcitrate dehydratase PrpD
LLADAGLDSAPDAIEAKFGLFDVFGRPADPGSIVRGLGASYLVSEISIKPYPCGVVIHPLIDACLGLSRERAIGARDVRAIAIAVHPRAVELAGRRHPDTAIGGRFSIYHAAALALARRSAGIAAFDAADVNEPQLIALRDCMQVEADARLAPGQARVQIEFINGTCAEQAVEFPSGSPERPLTDEQLSEKFLELACRCMKKGSAERLFESCLSLEQCADVAELRNHWVS